MSILCLWLSFYVDRVADNEFDIVIAAVNCAGLLATSSALNTVRSRVILRDRLYEKTKENTSLRYTEDVQENGETNKLEERKLFVRTAASLFEKSKNVLDQ